MDKQTIGLCIIQNIPPKILYTVCKTYIFQKIDTFEILHTASIEFASVY